MCKGGGWGKELDLPHPEDRELLSHHFKMDDGSARRMAEWGRGGGSERLFFRRIKKKVRN
jgi:hypothetical protein